MDILRASTTLVHALAAGAKAVYPVGEVGEAKSLASGFPTGTVLLGGEREGLLIDGFDLDNNPFAYTAEVVADKSVVFTTSNGTRALLHAQEADRILIGSFVNLQAVVYLLVADTRPIHLICAGTMGRVSLEDVLCAGGICHRLQVWADEFGVGDDFNCDDDQTQLALDHYWFRAAAPVDDDPEAIDEALQMSRGGRNCLRLGFGEQITRAATYDLFNFVPEYDKSTKSITITSPTLDS